MKVLLVEDEVSMARAIVRILEKNNYHGEAVYNGIGVFIEYGRRVTINEVTV